MLKSISTFLLKAPVLGFHHEPIIPVLSFIELKFSSICGVSVPRVTFPPLFVFYNLFVSLRSSVAVTN